MKISEQRKLEQVEAILDGKPLKTMYALCSRIVKVEVTEDGKLTESSQQKLTNARLALDELFETWYNAFHAI